MRVILAERDYRRHQIRRSVEINDKALTKPGG
jgi:hypothetical protein